MASDGSRSGSELKELRDAIACRYRNSGPLWWRAGARLVCQIRREAAAWLHGSSGCWAKVPKALLLLAQTISPVLCQHLAQRVCQPRQLRFRADRDAQIVRDARRGEVADEHRTLAQGSGEGLA